MRFPAGTRSKEGKIACQLNSKLAAAAGPTTADRAGAEPLINPAQTSNLCKPAN